MIKLRYLAFVSIILSILSQGAFAAGDQASFLSPKGKFEVTFTELRHNKFIRFPVKNTDEVSNIVYRIDFHKKDAEPAIASLTFHDVYGWDEDSAPATPEALFSYFIWSPDEDFAVIPDEGWASAPGTSVLKAISLNPELPWKATRFAFNKFFWTDRLSGIGDRHDDCDYEVEKFDGHTGKTIAIKESESPIGFELISIDNNSILIRQVLDNCRVEEQPPICFNYDLSTEKEEFIDCPAEIKRP